MKKKFWLSEVNHCVVMPDCDLDQAVNGLMGAAYGSAGKDVWLNQLLLQ